MRMLESIPALPVRDMARSLAFYQGQLGFTAVHQEEGFAVLRCDAVRLHLWRANDEAWRSRSGSEPVVSGAESFIAGTASCRIAVSEIDELYARLVPLGVVHPNGPLQDQWWGDRDFSTLDPDGNLVAFFERGGNSEQ